MPALAELARKPEHVVADEHFAPWFADLAACLLNATDFVVAGKRYRFAELEMYYSGGAHADPFAHRDPVQLERVRWYFHRTGGAYRSGSFKGLDLALGDGTAYFGVLVRTVIAPDDTVIDGPSLTVDHLLAQTQTASVGALDNLINARSIRDASSPLHIAEAKPPRASLVYSCSRVGLSLKKAKGKPDAPRFVGRPYRFLSEPARIAKGKPHLVLALHRAGHTPEAIRAVTGVPTKTIDRYVADFALGRRAENFDAYIGADLGTADLCKLLGTWAAKYGPPGRPAT